MLDTTIHTGGAAVNSYPLPWCAALAMPYWRANFICCAIDDAWREWQSGKSMPQIIAEIDRQIAEEDGK